MAKATIMIVEDKFIVAQDISTSLKKLGYEVCDIVSKGEDVLQAAKECQPEVVLMDVRLKGEMDGIEAASLLKRELSLPVIFLTAHSDEATLERASVTSPFGYLLKPFDDRQLYTTIELALNQRRILRDDSIEEKHAQTVPLVKEGNDIKARHEFSHIIGSHPKMLELFKSVELVARTDVSVHIYGENGTGKELIADAIHKLSARVGKPFIKLNCSAIPSTLLESALFGHSKGAFTGANKEQEGFIERAEGGTLFLDEIGDVSHDIQVKLLRVLQSREYNRVGETSSRTANIRVITATNRDLKELVGKNKIREDFYYRINVFPVIVPPLRERGDDILEIADHLRLLFNNIFSKEVQEISFDAKQLLLNYRWPGNVRELENAIKRAFVLIDGPCIEVSHLPPDVVKSGVEISLKEVKLENAELSRDEKEKDDILQALQAAGGSRTKAAEILGYSRVTLWKKLNKLAIGSAGDSESERESSVVN